VLDLGVSGGVLGSEMGSIAGRCHVCRLAPIAEHGSNIFHDELYVIAEILAYYRTYSLYHVRLGARVTDKVQELSMSDSIRVL
jgi:hypothetical protein